MKKVLDINGMLVVITDIRPEVVVEYDNAVLDCQKANCGFYILDLSEFPIDNEYDLEMIYTLINDFKEILK